MLFLDAGVLLTPESRFSATPQPCMAHRLGYLRFGLRRAVETIGLGIWSDQGAKAFYLFEHWHGRQANMPGRR